MYKIRTKKLEVSNKVRIFAQEIPPCMQITWVKPPCGGFICNRRMRFFCYTKNQTNYGSGDNLWPIITPEEKNAT